MIHWIKDNYTEVIGAFLALAYLILEVRQNRTMWIIGIISSLFYTLIFFEAKLYAQTGLNAYFAAMSVYGLYCWKYAKNSSGSLKITHIGIKTTGWLAVTGILLFALIALVLSKHTDSPVPYADTLVTVLSIIATWMVAHKFIEHWYLWIFINCFATGLYIYLELYPTAILYTVYSIMSFIGLTAWKKSMKKEGQKNG